MKRSQMILLFVVTLVVARVSPAAEKLVKIRVGYGTPAATQAAPRAIKAKTMDPADLLDTRFIKELDASGYIDSLYK